VNASQPHDGYERRRWRTTWKDLRVDRVSIGALGFLLLAAVILRVHGPTKYLLWELLLTLGLFLIRLFWAFAVTAPTGLDEERRLENSGLRDENNHLKDEIESLKRDRPRAVLTLRSLGGEEVVRLSRPLYTPMSPEEKEEELARTKAKHPHVKPSPFTMVRDAREYNSELDVAYKQYEEYMEARERQRRLTECTTPIVLVVANNGTAAARDLEVRLRLATPGLRFVDAKELDVSPTPPKFPSRSLLALDYAFLGRTNYPQAPPPKPERRVVFVDSVTARYESKTLLHGVPQEFSIQVFTDPSEASSGRIAYGLHADGQPRAVEGFIQLQIADDGVFAAGQLSDIGVPPA
jgi:hypothetical protein